MNMSYIELVIKIPEEYYNGIKSIPDNQCDADMLIIKYGTPLPKGHGRLIDADAICKDIISALGIRDENYLLESEKAIYKRIKTAPTIIEADTKSEG